MIRGEKVVLRARNIEDAALNYAWRQDEELSRLDAAAPLRMTFEEFLRLFAAELEDTNQRRQRFAIETLDGVVIGNCTYYDIDRPRRQCELGIVIGDKAYWGKGYGEDAVRTLLRHIFEATDIERVYLYTLDWNVRAQRSFRKAGFVEIGRAKDGRYSFINMEIRRRDWEKRVMSESEGARGQGSGVGDRGR